MSADEADATDGSVAIGAEAEFDGDAGAFLGHVLSFEVGDADGEALLG